MKLIAPQVLLLLLLAFLSGSLIGCASTSSGTSGIMEITDETEAQGCIKLGLIYGNSYWGGFTGQKLSLEIAKKRALEHALTKGATRILWLDTKKGFFGASVSGKAYTCPKNSNMIVTNSAGASKIFSLSKSPAASRQIGGYVAVMRFESIGIDSSVSMVTTDIFTNQIQANGKFRVMERSQINKVLGEQGLQSSGACNATECALKIGRLLNIDNMIIGSIGRLGESWVISIRIINIQTGEIVSSLSKKVTGKADDLSSAAIQMANEISQ